MNTKTIKPEVLKTKKVQTIKESKTDKITPSGAVLNVLDWNGNVVGEHILEESVFGLEYNQKIVHEVLRWQLNKRRQPIQKAKIRSEVAGAHRKIRAQKGSGRARQGDGKAPHFRGGGVAFGINPRTYEFKLNKKFKKLALCSFLSGKAQNKEIIVMNDHWTQEFEKTKHAKQMVEAITKGKPCSIICNNFENAAGLKILHKVNLLKPEGLNIHSCMKGVIIFEREALKNIENKLRRGEQK